MSLFFAELRKIWGGRVFPVLLAILASANLLLLWMGTRPTAKQSPASAYRVVGAELTGKTMEEKGSYLHDKYTEIERQSCGKVPPWQRLYRSEPFCLICGRCCVTMAFPLCWGLR